MVELHWEGSALQPAQQACYFKFAIEKIFQLVIKVFYWFTKWNRTITIVQANYCFETYVLNKPGVVGAVLQTPLSLINYLIN